MQHPAETAACSTSLSTAAKQHSCSRPSRLHARQHLYASWPVMCPVCGQVHSPLPAFLSGPRRRTAVHAQAAPSPAHLEVVFEVRGHLDQLLPETVQLNILFFQQALHLPHLTLQHRVHSLYWWCGEPTGTALTGVGRCQLLPQLAQQHSLCIAFLRNMRWCACSTGLAAGVLAHTLPWLAGQQMVYVVSSLCLLLLFLGSGCPLLLEVATSSHWPDLTSRTATRALLRLVSSLSFS